MEIQIQLELSDWKLYQSYIQKNLPKQVKTWMNSFWINFISWLIITCVFTIIFSTFNRFHIPTAISVSIFFIIVFVHFLFSLTKMKKAFEPLEHGVFCGMHKFTFSEDAIFSEGVGYQARHDWAIVKKVERAQGLIIIYLDSTLAYVFPEKKLGNPDEFHNRCISYYYSKAKEI